MDLGNKWKVFTLSGFVHYFFLHSYSEKLKKEKKIDSFISNAVNKLRDGVCLNQLDILISTKRQAIT